MKENNYLKVVKNIHRSLMKSKFPNVKFSKNRDDDVLYNSLSFDEIVTNLETFLSENDLLDYSLGFDKTFNVSVFNRLKIKYTSTVSLYKIPKECLESSTDFNLAFQELWDLLERLNCDLLTAYLDYTFNFKDKIDEKFYFQYVIRKSLPIKLDRKFNQIGCFLNNLTFVKVLTFNVDLKFNSNVKLPFIYSEFNTAILNASIPFLSHVLEVSKTVEDIESRLGSYDKYSMIKSHEELHRFLIACILNDKALTLLSDFSAPSSEYRNYTYAFFNGSISGTVKNFYFELFTHELTCANNYSVSPKSKIAPIHESLDTPFESLMMNYALMDLAFYTKMKVKGDWPFVIIDAIDNIFSDFGVGDIEMKLRNFFKKEDNVKFCSTMYNLKYVRSDK